MADGVIKGGDKYGYLGHFRGPNVVKEGHNFGFKDMFGAGKMKDAMGGAVNKMNPFGKHSGGTQAQKAKVASQNVKQVAKAGTGVNKYLNPVLAARVAKRESVQSAKAAGGDVKAARQAGRADVKAAKQVRSGFNAKENKLSRQSYKQTVGAAKVSNAVNKVLKTPAARQTKFAKGPGIGSLGKTR